MRDPVVELTREQKLACDKFVASYTSTEEDVEAGLNAFNRLEILSGVVDKPSSGQRVGQFTWNYIFEKHCLPTVAQSFPEMFYNDDIDQVNAMLHRIMSRLHTHLELLTDKTIWTLNEEACDKQWKEG